MPLSGINYFVSSLLTFLIQDATQKVATIIALIDAIMNKISFGITFVIVPGKEIPKTIIAPYTINGT